MASLASGDFSQLEGGEGGPYKIPFEKLERGGRWYLSRKEIEENSPSRYDGIDLKKEAYLRKSYCTFLQDLGMRLKVPQVTIATAIIFCHRFYLRQSHAKNDRRTIATACMFLAGKVEETPRPLKDVILVSYEIMHKKDTAAVHKIKQKDVYEQQKELILLGERVVLATLGFDMNVQHPYKPLVEAIKKFKVAQNALAQVAWNFVNDGLRTSLCLQFKSHHIAAGAIFLAAKFIKVKLPSDGEKVWWQEFDVTPRQLEEVSNQMLELYEQNRAATNQGSEAEGSVVGGFASRPAPRNLAEEQVPNGNSQAGASTKPGLGKPPTPNQLPDNSSKNPMSLRNSQNYKAHAEPTLVEPPVRPENSVEGPPDTRAKTEWNSSEDSKEKNIEGSSKVTEEGVSKEKHRSNDLELKETAETRLSSEVFEKIDANKLKEIREKRRKSRGEVVRKKDTMEEYDPILKELEEGVEQAAAESEKIRQEKKLNHRVHEELDIENVEEGEVSALLDDSSWDNNQSPKSNDRKRKAGSPLDKTSDRKHWHDRDHKRHLHENHA